MQSQLADLEWRDGNVPVSTRFQDPYYSLDNGLAEAEHVFLTGNNLPDRFHTGFHVAELGFGTGLNLLATLRAWRLAQVPGTLKYTSFEAFPLTASDIRRAQASFGELTELAGELEHYSGQTSFTLFDLQFEMVQGDARTTVPAWSGQADAWFLDGFSPAKNPELWEASLMQDVAAHTAANGTAATYTAAGFVRRGLEDAGFTVTRTQGFGRKRHMTQAVKDTK